MAYSSREDTGFFRTIHADLRSGDLRQTIGRDYTSLRDYALSEGQRRQLPGMSTLRRWFVVPWWILKRLFFALTPARRLLVLVGSLLIIASHQTGEHQNGIALAGALLLMFVLLLELKDKLAAREELDAGHAVQKALQPEESPRFPGWDLWLFTRPANEVGGDLVEFLRLEHGRGAVAIADVAGKGLRAALLAAKVQTMLRTLAPAAANPAALGTGLNAAFARETLPGVFTSLLYIEVEQNSPGIRILNAGHLPPALFSGAGGRSLEKGGAALGLMPAAVYAEQHATLAPGEFLVAWSDGAIEATNSPGEQYGEDRLHRTILEHQTLPARELGRHLMQSIDRFATGQSPVDDISFVILKQGPPS